MAASRIRYMRSFTYLFSYPEWMNRVGMGSLMMLIPMVGPLIIQGWAIQTMHRRIRGEEGLPKFDDLGEQIKLGLVPFLVGLIVMMPLMILLAIAAGLAIAVFGGVQAAIMSTMGPEEGGTIAGVVALVMALVMGLGGYAVLMCLSVFVQVLMLRVDLTGRFDEMFKFGEILEMSKAMFKPLFFGSLVVGLLSPFLMMAGYLACIIGIYPAMFIMTCAGYELRTQVYRDYLAKGNKPLTEVSFIDDKPLTLGPEL